MMRCTMTLMMAVTAMMERKPKVQVMLTLMVTARSIDRSNGAERRTERGRMSRVGAHGRLDHMCVSKR